MKENIFTIASRMQKGEITPEQAKEELLVLFRVTPRFSVSLVYQNQTSNMLRTLVTEASSKEEALGKAIQYFHKEANGFGLILKSVTHLNEG
jgi:predicted translin family RNA/ssDNA-binding protein